MTTVLLTAVGSASAHAALQSYRAAGWRVLGCDIYPREWTVNAGDMDAFFTVPPASEADAYADALLAAAQKHGVAVLVPLTDVEVDALCTRKAAFQAAGITLCCPDALVAALCRDKLRMAQEMEAARIVTPIPTFTRATLPKGLPFPLMLKPVRGRSSQAQVVAHDAGELAWALGLRDDYIIQPYLAGDIYTVDCARDTHGTCVALARRELLRTGNGLGVAVEICPRHPLAEACEAMLAHVNYVGVANVEFIRHGDSYAFLELNPRFSGGVGFSVLAGYDFPLAMARCHTGLALPPPPRFRAMTLAQRYEMRVTQS